MTTPLSDLDELILRCRDAEARELMAESLASYRAGAFRASIVATWIAVCFDIIEKLRELSLAGDSNATAKIAILEQSRVGKDIPRALAFEHSLLVMARDEFELLSPIEYMDLERLQEDRNRCAHPSLVSEESSYSPPAELARLHIHSAITHLLQHPPVQGKYALERIWGDIQSDYFPTKVSEAVTTLSAGPLRRPRDSLVRNLIVLLLKQLLKNVPGDEERRLLAATKAVVQLHFSQYEITLRDKLSTLFRAVDDSDLIDLLNAVVIIPGAWEALDADVRQRHCRIMWRICRGTPCRNWNTLRMQSSSLFLRL